MNWVIQYITSCSSKKTQLVMNIVFKDQYPFDFIHLNNTVNFLFSIISVGIKIGTENNVVEEEVDPQILLGLELSFILEERFQKWPINHLVDETVNSPHLFLILKIRHFARISPQPQLSRIDHSNSSKITTFHIRFHYQIQTFLTFYRKFSNILTRLIFIIIEV